MPKEGTAVGCPEARAVSCLTQALQIELGSSQAQQAFLPISPNPDVLQSKSIKFSFIDKCKLFIPDIPKEYSNQVPWLCLHMLPSVGIIIKIITLRI